MAAAAPAASSTPCQRSSIPPATFARRIPTKPPLWQIRAASATEDAQHKRIEYTNAEMQLYGVPVAYFPYFWTAEPGANRASGFLFPSMGYTSHIGGFFALPYYWVIDDQSDATFTPMLTTQGGPEMDVEYRRRFNNGYLTLNGSAGYFENSLQGTIFAKGQFDLNDEWRAGFNVNRASSADYVNDFHLGHDLGSDPSLLASNIYLEGFGQGAYSRLDTNFYQGLTTSITNSQLPVVLPRYQYSYFGQPDALGGRLKIDTENFNVLRDRWHEYPAGRAGAGMGSAVRRPPRRSLDIEAAYRRSCL